MYLFDLKFWSFVSMMLWHTLILVLRLLHFQRSKLETRGVFFTRDEKNQLRAGYESRFQRKG